MKNFILKASKYGIIIFIVHVVVAFLLGILSISNPIGQFPFVVFWVFLLGLCSRNAGGMFGGYWDLHLNNCGPYNIFSVLIIVIILYLIYFILGSITYYLLARKNRI